MHNVKRLNMDPDDPKDKKANSTQRISHILSKPFTWVSSIISKMINWINDNIIWYIYTKPLRRLKIIKDWWPIIWKDYHFDDAYLFDVMIFKITKMADRFENANLFVGVEYTVSKMRTVIKLLQKVRDEDYSTEYIDAFSTEFDFIELEEKSSSGNELYELQSTILEDNSKPFFEKYKNIQKRLENDIEYNTLHPGIKKAIERSNKSDQSQEEHNQSISHHISAYNHYRAKKLVFKMMERYIEHWWD